jgi:hypothetical protein
MFMPANISRCCDGLCPERETCRRFVERFAVGFGDDRLFRHADTLYAPGPHDTCTNRIPIGERLREIRT